MERKQFQIEAQDWEELFRLSREAVETPVIAMSVGDGLAGRDFASMARERVMGKWRELGKKYGFDWETVSPVDQDKGIVSAVAI